MKRAVLIFADANPVWYNEIERSEANNGILTAEEIADLNLNNTELLVLSACETGLGLGTETEGVYGLQRAFKLSGVKSIVLSLWEVLEIAGQEFMTVFYHELIISGKERHEAFRIAQKILREKHPSEPYIWAVFVMLD
jgi:CHAT domain-containing protein